MPLQQGGGNESPTTLFLSNGVQYPDFFSCLRRYFFRLRRPTYFTYTMLGPKPIYSEFDNMFYGVAQLNAGGCSNGIRTTLPTRARIATNGLRIPQEQTKLVLGPKLVPKNRAPKAREKSRACFRYHIVLYFFDVYFLCWNCTQKNQLRISKKPANIE